MHESASLLLMSKNKPPHRHHYIPQMILRNFLNTDGGLYFWRREFGEGEVRSTVTENLFIEDNLYTIVGDDGERSVALEEGFAKMESVSAQFIDQLLAIVRSRAMPRLDDRSWELFHLFYYFAGKRSAAWHRRFVTRDEVVAVVNEIAMEPHWTDADRAWLNDQTDIDRVMNNARISAQGTAPPDDLMAIMRQLGMTVYVAPRGASFVLGDHPVAMAKISHVNTRADAGGLSFMPVAHDVALGFFSAAREVHVEHVSRRELRTMNEAMTRQSMMIAGRSDALLRSLSRVGYLTPDHFSIADYLGQ